MDTYPTFSAVIDALGGSAALGQIIGKSVGTASAMKTRDVIPPAYWDDVVQGAGKLGVSGISHQLLSQLYAARRARASEPEPEAA